MSTTLSDDDVVTQNIMSVYTVMLCVFESYCDDMKIYGREMRKNRLCNVKILTGNLDGNKAMWKWLC